MKKTATYEEISLECAKHALEFLHYIATFRNLNPSELYEVRKFIHIISGYNKALKKSIRSNKMRFEEALKAMREGKKVATNERFRERYFVDALYIEKGCLMWRCIDDEDYPVDDCDYGLSGKEIMSEDWEVLE